MRRLNKLAAVCVALAMVLAAGLMVSCSSDSENSAVLTPAALVPTVRATYAATGKDGTYTIYAGSNGKFEMYLSNTKYGTILVAKGTYTIDSGDETNGTMSITTTGEMQNGSWVTITNPTAQKITIVNGKFSMKIGSSNYEFSKQ